MGQIEYLIKESEEKERRKVAKNLQDWGGKNGVRSPLSQKPACFCIEGFFGVKLNDFCFNREFNNRKLFSTRIFGTENPTSEKQLSLSF